LGPTFGVPLQASGPSLEAAPPHPFS